MSLITSICIMCFDLESLLWLYTLSFCLFSYLLFMRCQSLIDKKYSNKVYKVKKKSAYPLLRLNIYEDFMSIIMEHPHCGASLISMLSVFLAETLNFFFEFIVEWTKWHIDIFMSPYFVWVPYIVGGLLFILLLLLWLWWMLSMRWLYSGVGLMIYEDWVLLMHEYPYAGMAVFGAWLGLMSRVTFNVLGFIVMWIAAVKSTGL